MVKMHQFLKLQQPNIPAAKLRDNILMEEYWCGEKGVGLAVAHYHLKRHALKLVGVKSCF